MIQILIYIFFTLIYSFSSVGLTNSVDAPQYRLTQSIVEEKTLYIDNNLDLTWPDISLANNHYISGRGPGESFFAIPFYFMSKLLSSIIKAPYEGQRDGIDQFSGIEATTSIMNSIFGALCVVVVYLLSNLLYKNKKSSLFTAFIFGLGTLIWKYSSIFYRHSLCLFFLLTSIYFIFNLISIKKTKIIHLICFGISLGFAIFLEPISLFFSFISILIYIYFLYKNKSGIKQLIKKGLIISGIIFMINLPIIIYNQKISGSIGNTGWSGQVVNTWLSDKSFTFSTPLLPSILTNLFSPNKPIPEFTFSPKLLKNEIIKENQSYYFAKIYPYKGLFFQSPFLFLIILPPFFIRKIKYFPVLLILAFASILPQLKYVVFYSPNSYDTRFFLYFAAITSLLINQYLIYLDKTKNRLISISGWTIFFILSFISIFNAWVSSVENYAPHITGEKRAIAQNLLINGSIREIIVETFPNIYNFQVIIIFIIISLAIYFLVKYLYIKFIKKLFSSSYSQ